MADFPFHYDVSQRAVETCGGGVSSKKGKVWGLCQFLSIFDTKYITVFLGWAADATVSDAAMQERSVLVRDFPRVLHLGFLTMVWYRVRISQACLATMLLTWDASKNNKTTTNGSQRKTFILVWNNVLLSPSIHCTFDKSFVTLHFDHSLQVEHWLCNYMSC